MTTAYKVLFVEDDPDTRTLIERFLELEGYEVYAAESGQRGIDKLREVMPDVCLIDFNLPDCNAHEFIQRLNQRDEMQEIPKIIFSAQPVHRKRISDGGSDFFIQKPVDISTLAGKIEYAIRHPKQSSRYVL